MCGGEGRIWLCSLLLFWVFPLVKYVVDVCSKNSKKDKQLTASILAASAGLCFLLVLQILAIEILFPRPHCFVCIVLGGVTVRVVSVAHRRREQEGKNGESCTSLISVPTTYLACEHTHTKNIFLEGHVNELRQLQAINANLFCSDYDQRTPLHLAASEGHTEV